MKRLIAVLLVFVIFLTSCGVNTPGETGGVTAHADQTAEVTDAVTEEQTEAPAATDDLSYEQPAVARSDMLYLTAEKRYFSGSRFRETTRLCRYPRTDLNGACRE